MNRLPFPLLTLFVIFILWFAFNRSRMSRKTKQAQDEYWERESLANSTRKQNLDGLPYIYVPLKELPFLTETMDSSDSDLAAIEREVQALSERKIVNFTGISNTELKLQYGAPNLDLLTEYDDNFTALAQLLFRWGTKLSDLAFQREAIQVLEYGVRIGSDIRGHYLLLANLYRNTSQNSQIQRLIDQAETLNSLNRNSIIRSLIALQTGTGLSEDGRFPE